MQIEDDSDDVMGAPQWVRGLKFTDYFFYEFLQRLEGVCHKILHFCIFFMRPTPTPDS